MTNSFKAFLNFCKDKIPEEFLEIDRELNPSDYEATAILQHLENQNLYPLVLFDKPKNLLGGISKFPLVMNVFASIPRCAIALNLPPSEERKGIGLKYAQLVKHRLTPVRVSKKDAPVKEAIHKGDEVDLRIFPIVRHHDMDPAPYIDMVVVHIDPDEGFYNMAFQRTMYKGPRKLGLRMAPRHNLQISRKYEDKGKAAPVIIVVSHHPAFYIGSLNLQPFGSNDYEVVGSIMESPLRIVESETWGENFMIPADADIIIEGEIPPGVREVEGPFGEWTGYVGPQRYYWIIDVKAISYRNQAVYQDVFVGHRDNWILGLFPLEGELFNSIKSRVPNVRKVSLPLSGNCRFNCYISLDKKVEGEQKVAALAAISASDFIKNVILVDSDIDPENEQDVLWAVATRTQPDRDVDIIRHIKGNPLDPSITSQMETSKMIIDATRPIARPFHERIKVPDEVMNRIKIEGLKGLADKR